MNGVIVYMHRLIAGTPAGKETDHINGNGLDNRRANLRVATASQNSANTRKPRIGRPHSSRYKGGRFNAEDEAARAYDSAAVAAWGEFARTNFEQTGANNG